MQKVLPKDHPIAGMVLSSVRLLHLVGVLVFLLSLSGCASNAGLLGGGNWQSSGLQHQHIHRLTVDPNNAQVLYAGDEQGSIFTSLDGAQHWTQVKPGLPLPNTLHDLSFDTTGKKLYVATDTGLFVSTDGAQHWSNVGATTSGLPADSYTALAFNYNSADAHAVDAFYVGTLQHGVLVSTNRGTAWSPVGSGLPQGIAINGLTFDYDQHQLWAATSLGVYRSDVRSETWQSLNTGLPPGTTVYTVQLASLSGGTKGLIFVGTDHGFFRSEDYGAHWTTSQMTFSRIGVRTIVVDFRNANTTTVFMGTDIGAFRSDDNGQSWTRVAAGLPPKPVYALALGASGYSQLIAAADDVYLFPGSSGGLGLTRLLPLLFFAALILLVYRFAGRNRRKARQMLRPERIVEQPLRTSTPTALSSFKPGPQDEAQTHNVRPSPQEEVDMKGEARERSDS